MTHHLPHASIKTEREKKLAQWLFINQSHVRRIIEIIKSAENCYFWYIYFWNTLILISDKVTAAQNIILENTVPSFISVGYPKKFKNDPLSKFSQKSTLRIYVFCRKSFNPFFVILEVHFVSVVLSVLTDMHCFWISFSFQNGWICEHVRAKKFHSVEFQVNRASNFAENSIKGQFRRYLFELFVVLVCFQKREASYQLRQNKEFVDEYSKSTWASKLLCEIPIPESTAADMLGRVTFLPLLVANCTF